MNPILLANLFGANAAASSAQGGNQSSPWTMIIMVGALFVVMYFMTIRPQKKRQKEEQELRASIEVGDEIVTIGGIVGRVVTVREKDIVIETGSDRNKMKLERWAVNTNRTKAEQRQKELDAAKEAAKAKKAEKKNKKDVVDETKGNKE